MKTFKASVSKGTKRFNIGITAQDEAEAKVKIHKGGYTILSLAEVEDIKIEGKKFYFDVIVAGEKKSGTIAGEDISKVYRKLVDDLKYNVISLYDDPNLDEKGKSILMHSVVEQYNVFKDKNLGDKKEQKTKEKKPKEEVLYIGKDLDKIQKTNDMVLFKLDRLIQSEGKLDIPFDTILQLKNLKEGIIKIKKSTNIDKLKEVGEKALLKLGEIEMNFLEKKKTEEYKKAVKETNQLLKQLGSKCQFIEKEKDIKYIYQKYKNNLKEKLSKENKQNKQKKQKVVIDKTSSSYLKTIVLIEKYETKLKDNTKNIIKNFYVFLWPFGNNLVSRDKLIMRNAVIKQNIRILKNKIKGNNFSYTKVKKLYKYFVDIIISSLHFLKDPLFLLSLFYSISFIVAIVCNNFLNAGLTFSKEGLFYFLVLQLFLIVCYLMKGLFSIFFNIVFFSFIVIFLAVNF